MVSKEQKYKTIKRIFLNGKSNTEFLRNQYGFITSISIENKENIRSSILLDSNRKIKTIATFLFKKNRKYRLYQDIRNSLDKNELFFDVITRLNLKLIRKYEIPNILIIPETNKLFNTIYCSVTHLYIQKLGKIYKIGKLIEIYDYETFNRKYTFICRTKIKKESLTIYNTHGWKFINQNLK